MSKLPIGVDAPKVALIYDNKYYITLQNIIAKSNRICLASVFIVELKSGGFDRDLKVYQILKLLREAQWRGVEVKLIIGGSRDNLLIAQSSEVARYITLSMGIDCKWLTSVDLRGSHSKVVIADDFVLSGSHNWSASAFINQIQDSILVESPALSSYCQDIFYNQWNRK